VDHTLSSWRLFSSVTCLLALPETPVKITLPMNSPLVSLFFLGRTSISQIKISIESLANSVEQDENKQEWKAKYKN
jgi:hypothetical protein